MWNGYCGSYLIETYLYLWPTLMIPEAILENHSVNMLVPLEIRFTKDSYLPTVQN